MDARSVVYDVMMQLQVGTSAAHERGHRRFGHCWPYLPHEVAQLGAEWVDELLRDDSHARHAFDRIMGARP
jgi:hypothetical protein